MISVLHHFDLYHEGFNGLAETLEESTHLNFSYEWKKIELMFFLKTLFGQPDPEKSLLFGIGTNIVISDHLLFAMDLSYQNDQENFLSQVKIDWFVKSLFFSYSFRKNGKSNYTMHNIDLRYPF
jgi:hypothetical protein